jgi:hypothetical protein
MDLVKSWLGQALRATGAAIVVPAAIIVALALTALGDGGGLGSLGSLSQIVSGPQAAGSDVSVDDGEAEIADAVTQLAASDPASAVAPVAGTGPGDPNGGVNDPVGTPPTGTDPRGDGSPPGDGAPPPENGPGDGGNTPPPSEPPPPDPPDPGAVGGIGERVKDVTEGTPVAPTVEDAVDTLVETCGRLGCP